LNEKEEKNPWTPPVTGRLISPPGTPDTRILLNKNEAPRGENFLIKSSGKPYGGTSNLRFRPDPEENPF